MNVEIAPLGEDEYSAVVELWYDSWLSTGAEHGEGVTRAILEQRLRDEPWAMWVAHVDETIAAFLAIDRADLCLSQLFVAPGYQNRGIGLELFRLAQVEMPDGFWLRANEDNAGARRFYHRHGLVLERMDAGRAYYRWTP